MMDEWEVLVITPVGRPCLTFSSNFQSVDELRISMQMQLDFDLVNCSILIIIFNPYTNKIGNILESLQLTDKKRRIQ